MTIIFTLYIIGGAVMDTLALLLITIPIFFSVTMKLGYDPIWFGVIVTVVTTMGAITPSPVGVRVLVGYRNGRRCPFKKCIQRRYLFYLSIYCVYYIIDCFSTIRY